jgi:hypothetical protein
MMTRLIVLFSAIAYAALAHAQPSLIPQPVRYQQQEGNYTLKPASFVDAGMAVLPQYLKTLNAATGFNLRMAPADAPCAIQFLSGEMRGSSAKGNPLGEGAYHLRITPNAANIYAVTPSGHFYGM